MPCNIGTLALSRMGKAPCHGLKTQTSPFATVTLVSRSCSCLHISPLPSPMLQYCIALQQAAMASAANWWMDTPGRAKQEAQPQVQAHSIVPKDTEPWLPQCMLAALITVNDEGEFNIECWQRVGCSLLCRAYWEPNRSSFVKATDCGAMRVGRLSF